MVGSLCIPAGMLWYLYCRPSKLRHCPRFPGVRSDGRIEGLIALISMR